MVSVGLPASDEVNWLPSETKRLGISWLRPQRSTTPASGAALMRQVPRLCETGSGGEQKMRSAPAASSSAIPRR